MSYPLANLAVRFNVGARSFNQFIKIQKTVSALQMVTLFKKQGLIETFFVSSMFIEVKLKYFHKKPLIRSLEVISKPGRRIFWSLEQLSRFYSVRSFSGFFVISTPKGVFTSNECLTTVGMSGEILYKITLN